MNWKAYFSLGVVYHMLEPKCLQEGTSLLEGIEKIALDPYFDGIEIPLPHEGIRAEARELLASAGLDLVVALQPFMLNERINLAAVDEKERCHGISCIKQAIEQAYELNAKRVILMDGYCSYPGEEKQEQALEALGESLHELCAYTEHLGEVQLSLETFDRSVEKNCLLGPTKLAVDLLTEVAKEHCSLGLTLDLAHLHLLAEDWGESLEIAADQITHIHISNCVTDSDHPLYGDYHPPFNIQGGRVGCLELATFFQQLLKLGLIRQHNPDPLMLSFEINTLRGDPEINLAYAKRCLDRAWHGVY